MHFSFKKGVDMEMYGEYEHTVDAKGRMNFPAKLREEFGEHFYICKSLNEKCLTVYTAESWEALKASLRGKPSKIAKPIERFLIGGGSEVEPDKQGSYSVRTSRLCEYHKRGRCRRTCRRRGNLG